MKWSPILHAVAAVSGILGALALIGAWIARQNGTFLGFSQNNLYIDATNLFLASIGFGIGTLIHQNQERK